MANISGTISPRQSVALGIDAEIASLIADETSATAVQLRSTLSRAALLYDPATKSNGQLAASLSADTGQAMTMFTRGAGAAPLKISSGVITHDPVAQLNAGGYLQANLGGQVRRMGAQVSWPLNASGACVFALPSAPWSSAPLANAGFHLKAFGNGVWSLTRFTTGGETTLADQTTHGRYYTAVWGTGLHPMEFWISPEDQKAVITWPDGTATTVTSSYFDTETSDYCVWELFEGDGTTEVPGSFGALWADTAPTTLDAAGLTSYQRPGHHGPAPHNISGAVTLDLSGSDTQLVTMTGNVTTLVLSGVTTAGTELEIQFIQDGTGSRTLAGVTSTIKWAGGSTPTLTTTASKRDIFRFRYYGGSYYEVSRSMNVG